MLLKKLKDFKRISNTKCKSREWDLNISLKIIEISSQKYCNYMDVE